MQTARPSRQMVSLAIAGSLVLTGASGCASSDSSGGTEKPVLSSPSTPQAIEEVLPGSGRDRTASQTADDWVTYADHVMIVTVVRETRQEPSQEEIERGEGMIGRRVDIRVDRVLWSAPEVAQPAPRTLSWEAAGWAFNENSGMGTRKFALDNASRLEVGRTYIKAIQWIDDPCQSDPEFGGWNGLGSGDTIPFDGGVMGAGEFEGRVQTLGEAKAGMKPDSPAAGIREQMIGMSVDALTTALTEASPRIARPSEQECNPLDK